MGSGVASLWPVGIGLQQQQSSNIYVIIKWTEEYWKNVNLETNIELTIIY